MQNEYCYDVYDTMQFKHEMIEPDVLRGMSDVMGVEDGGITPYGSFDAFLETQLLLVEMCGDMLGSHRVKQTQYLNPYVIWSIPTDDLEMFIRRCVETSHGVFRFPGHIEYLSKTYISTFLDVPDLKEFDSGDLFAEHCTFDFTGHDKLERLVTPQILMDVDICAKNCKNLQYADIRIAGLDVRKQLAFLVPYSNTMELQEEIFMNCTSLQTVLLDRSIEQINKNCFRNCTALQEIQLPPKLKAVEERSFAGSGLRVFEAPLCLEKIGVGAFEGCKDLQTVTLMNTSSIGEHAFSGCDSLECIHLPQTVTQVWGEVFRRGMTIMVHNNDYVYNCLKETNEQYNCGYRLIRV